MNLKNSTLMAMLAVASISDFASGATSADYTRPPRDHKNDRAYLSAAQKKRDRKNQKRLASRNGAK